MYLLFVVLCISLCNKDLLREIRYCLKNDLCNTACILLISSENTYYVLMLRYNILNTN